MLGSRDDGGDIERSLRLRAGRRSARLCGQLGLLWIEKKDVLLATSTWVADTAAVRVVRSLFSKRSRRIRDLLENGNPAA